MALDDHTPAREPQRSTGIVDHTPFVGEVQIRYRAEIFGSHDLTDTPRQGNLEMFQGALMAVQIRDEDGRQLVLGSAVMIAPGLAGATLPSLPFQETKGDTASRGGNGK